MTSKLWGDNSVKEVKELFCMGILERGSREFTHIEGVLSVYLCKRGQKRHQKNLVIPIAENSRAKYSRCLYRKVSMPKNPSAKKSQCWKVPVPKSTTAEKSPCQKNPVPKSPRAKKSTCWNVHVSECHRTSQMPKYFCAKMFQCRKVPVPKRPHAETFPCWNVHLPKRLQRRKVHMPECSRDEISVPKWLLPKCPVPKRSTGVIHPK